MEEDKKTPTPNTLPATPMPNAPISPPVSGRKRNVFLITAAFISLGIIGIAAVLFTTTFHVSVTKRSKTSISKQVPQDQTKDWLVYQSAPGGFLVKYPPTSWNVYPNDITGAISFNIIPLSNMNYIENISFKRQGVVMPTPNDLMYITVWKSEVQNAKTTLQNTLNSISNAPGFSGGTISPFELNGKNAYSLTYGFAGQNGTTVLQSELVGFDDNGSTYILAGGKTPEFDSFVSSFQLTPSPSQLIGMPPPAFPCSDGVESWQIGGLCTDGGSYTSGSYTCSDGKSGTVSSPTCTTAQSLRDQAAIICGNSPKSCPIPTPLPTIGPSLDTFLEYLVPTGWSTTQSDSSQITLQSPDYNYSNYTGGGTQQGQEITITRIPNTQGATLDTYKNGPFKSYAKTTHDGLDAFVGIVSYKGLPDAPNNLMYNYIIIKKGYIWTISYIVFSPNSKNGPQYQQTFNSFLDSLHLK